MCQITLTICIVEFWYILIYLVYLTQNLKVPLILPVKSYTDLVLFTLPQLLCDASNPRGERRALAN